MSTLSLALLPLLLPASDAVPAPADSPATFGFRLGADRSTVREVRVRWRDQPVATLLGAAREDAEAFVGRFAEEQGLRPMEKRDLGAVTLRSCTDEHEGFEVSIEGDTNLRIQHP